MRFDDALACFQAYVEEVGDVAVPRSFVTRDGFRLGVWVHNARSRYRRGALTMPQVEALERMGFSWRTMDRDTQRERAVAALSAYRTAHQSLPAADFVTPEGFALGAWLQALKYRARLHPGDDRTRASRLLAELRIPLWERNVDDLWTTGLEALRGYVDARGDTRVPYWWRTPAGFALGRWVNSRRADAAAGRLRAERRAELDALGFEYVLASSPHSSVRKAREEAHFRSRMSELQVFSVTHGHPNVPARFVTERGTPLGRWVVRQRRENAAGRLAPERVAQLDVLGFQWKIDRARPDGDVATHRTKGPLTR